jgi:type II secretory pathway pseudopilin PulG
MVAITIVAILAAIAVPAFARLRQNARNGRFISDLRVFAQVFQNHVMQSGEWPAGAAPGVVPPEVADAMPKGWVTTAPVGGLWRWESAGGVMIEVVGPTADASDYAKIDGKIDDGNSSTGLFRLNGSNWNYLLQSPSP